MKPELGRPRKFNKDHALAKATHVFWTSGYHGASLSNLTQAMEINKPSLYAAYGNKQALYECALEAYGETALEAAKAALCSAPNLEQACMNMLCAAVHFYTPEDKMHLGCFIANVSSAAVTTNENFANTLLTFLNDADQFFSDILQTAFPEDIAATHLQAFEIAQLLTTATHSLSLRARAGMPRDKLMDIARLSVRQIIGAK